MTDKLQQALEQLVSRIGDENMLRLVNDAIQRLDDHCDPSELSVVRECEVDGESRADGEAESRN